MNEEKRKRIFAARRAGTSPDVAEKMREADATVIWSGVCRRCKQPVKGTLEECRTHRCADSPILPTLDQTGVDPDGAQSC